jgi:hypothetical protein
VHARVCTLGAIDQRQKASASIVDILSLCINRRQIAKGAMVLAQGRETRFLPLHGKDLRKECDMTGTLKPFIAAGITLALSILALVSLVQA